MSLFERLKNKRYDLQEQDKPKQLTIDDPWFDGEETKNTNNTSSGNASSGSKPKGSGTRTIKNKGKKGVDYFFDPAQAKQDRLELINKRKKYGIDPSGKIANEKDAVKKFLDTANTKGYGRTTGKPSKIGKNPEAVRRALEKTTQQMKDPKVVKQTLDKIKDQYGRRLSQQATKAELDATKAAIKSSKSMNVKPLPKVYDAKASKELTKQYGKETNVFRRIKKTLPRKTKLINTPTRRVQLIKPKPLPKTINPIKTTTFPSSPLRPSNRIYTPSPTELQKLTSTGFRKTTTGAFTKSGKKSFTKLLAKGLSKMGTRGKVAAGLLALGTTTYGINKVRTLNKTKKQNTMVPPIGFNQKQAEPMKFGISLGPGQQQK